MKAADPMDGLQTFNNNNYIPMNTEVSGLEQITGLLMCMFKKYTKWYRKKMIRCQGLLD